ncbi:MAG TPA: DUF3426 domain-containing protein [Rhodanobacteraceae bacterium]|nr:DUF3426 domain-containing protein [Rhodanobacteraceae bacterium]
MYTQCPQCLTVFQIDEDALQASFGIVQCGHCATRFDALRTLSNTLPPAPNAPLGEHDSAERVPTLTDAVPSNSFVPPREIAAPPEAPPPESVAGEAGAHAVAIDVPLPESGQPVPCGSPDWFADFETELTSSLIADATRTEPDSTAGDNAWQVTDLPAQSLFSGPEPPVVLADFRLYDEELVDQAAWCASLEDAGALVSGAPDAGEPELPAPGSEGVEWSADGIAAPTPKETEQATTGEAGAVTRSEPDTPEEASPAEPAPAPMPRREALPASLFLVHEAADPDLAEAADPRQPQAPLAEQPEVPEPASSDEPAPSDEPVPPHAEVISDPAEPLPPVYVRPRRRRTAGVAWALGCFVLIVVLAAQVAWSKRVELFRDPASHAWTARACQVIDCHLPPIRDLAKLELVSRDVRPDPRVAGALTITATLRNDAHFRQPWPVVVVELADLDNNPVAMRRFRPAEYMPDPVRRAAGIAPGATSAIAFEVADPGKRAVSFQFNFE